jgi:hypothetical protein
VDASFWVFACKNWALTSMFAPVPSWQVKHSVLSGPAVGSRRAEFELWLRWHTAHVPVEAATDVELGGIVVGVCGLTDCGRSTARGTDTLTATTRVDIAIEGTAAALANDAGEARAMPTVAKSRVPTLRFRSVALSMRTSLAR